VDENRTAAGEHHSGAMMNRVIMGKREEAVNYANVGAVRKQVYLD